MLTFKRNLSLFALIFLLSGMLFQVKAQMLAQDKSVAQAPQKNAQQADNSLPDLHLPTERTGVDRSSTFKLSMRDAIEMAIEHNLGIQAQKDNIKIAEYNLQSAFGFYDIVGGSSFNYTRANTPSGSSLNVGGNSLVISSQTYNYSFNVSRQLTTGGSILASFNNTRTTTNNSLSLLDPSYQPAFSVQLTQPLMRNFLVNTNTINVKKLKKQLDLSDSQFRQQLINLIAQVQSSYYDLVYAISNEQIQLESVELAAEQLRNNQIQVKAGAAAPLDVVSAETQLELRKDAAISALPPITQAENNLKILLLDDPTSDIWNMRIEPTDSIDVTNEPIDLQSAISIAMDRRPEIKQLETQGELNDLDLQLYKNQAKPQVDLTASFAGNGLAGTAKPFTPLPGIPPVAADTTFNGGYGTALGNLFDYRTYSVGVTISFPFRNRTAKANIARTEVTAHQLDTQKRQMIQQIISDVRNAVQNVEAAHMRVDVAHAGVIAAQEQLKGEEEKFAAGLSTNFFVLQRQTDLATAQGNELKAKTDYYKARSVLQQVMANNIP